MPRTTHDMVETSEYRSWLNMKQRCFNPNNKDYLNWGGRGINVCDRWKNSFENFFADMGTKPSSKHSLDRIDNNGNYSAENCKWSTRVEQANNKSNNRLIMIESDTLTIAQWAKKMSISEQVIRERLYLGWSERDSVMIPVRVKSKLITIENKTQTIAQWAKEMNIGANVIGIRLDRGWSEFNAVMTPVRFRSKSTKKLSRIC